MERNRKMANAFGEGVRPSLSSDLASFWNRDRGRELTTSTVPEMVPLSWPVAVQPVVAMAFKYEGQLMVT